MSLNLSSGYSEEYSQVLTEIHNEQVALVPCHPCEFANPIYI